MRKEKKYKHLDLNRPWREIAHEIIFEADTFWGKFFDVGLLWAILVSVIIVMLESVREIAFQYGFFISIAEWSFTVLFTAEYFLRIYTSPKPSRYIFSFYGIIDLLSILPTYLALVLTGTQFLLIIRILRLLRVFRVLKLVRYSSESEALAKAMYNSRMKITVFLGGVISAAVILGTLMYIIETPEAGFTSIPKSIYWAIVTLTTVGYGDIAPQTVAGQFLASFIMIIGYGVIAVPTGIVSAEFAQAKAETVNHLREETKVHSPKHCPQNRFKGFYLKDTFK
jgi:voltage-gated potassium channel